MIVGLSLMSTACGKKGPLIYPDMLVPAAPSAVIARQSGAAVKLQFLLPEKDRAGRVVQGVAGVKVGKRAAETDPKDVCRSCMSDYSLFRTLYLEHLPTNTERIGNRLIVIDGDVTAGNSYSYNIVPFTADGVDGAPFTTADVRVIVPFQAPVLKVESLPTEVKIELILPPQMPGRLIGFNLYRWSASTARSYQPLNREPLKGGEYVDSGLERGVKYHYSVRVLLTMASGDVVESAESNEVTGMLKDDE
jgi:predicted small lipoprotein YifL